MVQFMKKRYMIKIVGSADGNHFESAYRRKHLNYYCVVIKQNPKFYKIVLFHKFSFTLCPRDKCHRKFA